MNREFTPSSPAARSLFAAVAVVVTLSIGGFIDYLATDYAANGSVQATAKQTVVVAAQR
jgi:hypothetical protein